MGIFRKKDTAEVSLLNNTETDKEREEARLKALEASLEFLNKPGAQQKKDEATTEVQPKIQTPAQPAAPVKPNPVAPAIQPPDMGKHTLNGGKITEEKKTETAPVPRGQDEAMRAEESVAAKPMSGRRMDYRTAVVKSGPHSRPLMPTSVSNLPPAPPMPQNTQNKTPEPPEIPEKTIVPTVPVIPSEPVQRTEVADPAEIPPQKTIVAVPQNAVQPELPIGGTEAPQAPVNTAPAKPLPRNESVETKKDIPAAVKNAPLKNPLPTPKKHIPREMDFDMQPISSQMHFDVVDMNGIDYFDIN